jgi:hypothetical protein
MLKVRVSDGCDAGARTSRCGDHGRRWQPTVTGEVRSMKRLRLLVVAVLLGVFAATATVSPAAASPKHLFPIETTCGDTTYLFGMNWSMTTTMHDLHSNARFVIHKWVVTPPGSDTPLAPWVDRGFGAQTTYCTATCPEGSLIEWWGVLTPAKGR